MGADRLSAQGHHPLRQVSEWSHGEVRPAEEEHGCWNTTGATLCPLISLLWKQLNDSSDTLLIGTWCFKIKNETLVLCCSWLRLHESGFGGFSEAFEHNCHYKTAQQEQPILHQPLPVSDSVLECLLYLCIRLRLPLLGSTLYGLNLLHPKRSGPPAHWPSILTSTMSKNHPTTLSSPDSTCISATTAPQIPVMNFDHSYLWDALK